MPPSRTADFLCGRPPASRGKVPRATPAAHLLQAEPGEKRLRGGPPRQPRQHVPADVLLLRRGKGVPGFVELSPLVLLAPQRLLALPADGQRLELLRRAALLALVQPDGVGQVLLSRP